MKCTLWLVAAAVVLSAATGFCSTATSTATTDEVAGLPLHIEKLGPGVIRLWVGDTVSSTAVVAMATEKGILVIDTTGNPRVDRELRRIIARELGRSDFKYLINTHEHGDHTRGNSVYADCTIVGHERVAAGMAAQEADRARFLEWGTTHASELEQELAKQPADPAAAAKLQEQLTLARLNLESLQAAAKSVPPTKTFSDHMRLDLGDTAVEMYWIGGMHSPSDIAVFVPKHGLLLTGDTMADVWLTDTPGCLASFAARSGMYHDFPLWLANWKTLIARKADIETLVPGHWNGTLSWAGAEARVDYVRTLWEGVQQGVAAGRSLEDLMTDFRLSTRFPALADSPGFSQNNHHMTVLEMWSLVTNQQSAADRLYTLIDTGAEERAIRALLAERDVKPPKYYFLEAQMNFQGYRFLQENKPAQAVTLLRLNAELFPASWNTYDSLGEALLQAGDSDGAVRMYEKSLELNPDNQNGKDALARIRTQRVGG